MSTGGTPRPKYLGGAWDQGPGTAKYSSGTQDPGPQKWDAGLGTPKLKSGTSNFL